MTKRTKKNRVFPRVRHVVPYEKQSERVKVLRQFQAIREHLDAAEKNVLKRIEK